jgi:acid-sensing ion channel, other
MTAISQVCDPAVFGKIDPKNLTDCAECVDDLRNISIPIGNMIVICYFKQVRYARSKLFKETVTEDGICYTFNGIKSHEQKNFDGDNWTLEKGYTTPILNTYPRRAIGTGADYSLNLFLGLCTYDFDYICRNSAQGFKVGLANTFWCNS